MSGRGGVWSSPYMSLVGDSVSENSQGSRLVDSVGLSVELLFPLGLSSFLQLFFQKRPDLHPMFGCGSLHLFESAAG